MNIALLGMCWCLIRSCRFVWGRSARQQAKEAIKRSWTLRTTKQRAAVKPVMITGLATAVISY
jgi:hypothetical protein